MDDLVIFLVIGLVIFTLVYLLIRDTQNNSTATYTQARDTRTESVKSATIGDATTVETGQSNEDFDWLRTTQEATKVPTIREIRAEPRSVDNDDTAGV